MLGFISSAWNDREVNASIRGLKHAQKFPDRFDSFILRDLWVRLHRWGSIESEFAKVIYLGFVSCPPNSIRRLPIDTRIPGRRPSQSFAHARPRAHWVTGCVVRRIWRLDSRSVKMSERFRLSRVRAFAGGRLLLRISYVRFIAFWPAVRRASEVNQSLFPTMKSKSGNRILKSILAIIDIPEANRYSLKGLRRGVATEVMRSGSTLSTILGIGGVARPRI